MSKYLNPKSDLTFKKVFGEHKDLSLMLTALYGYPPCLMNDRYVVKSLHEYGDTMPIESILYSIDKYWDQVSRERTALNAAERKGREQGLEEGREEERVKAYQEKLAGVRNLKSLGTLSNAQIANALGLTEAEVEQA